MSLIFKYEKVEKEQALNIPESCVIFDDCWTLSKVVLHQPAVVNWRSAVFCASVESNRLVEPSGYLASGIQIANHIS